MQDRVVSSLTSHGGLETVKIFLEGEPGFIVPFAIDCGAAAGRLDSVQYLRESRRGGCSSQAMANAAAYGYVDIIKLLYHNRTEGCSLDPLDRAGTNGHREVVKFLHDKYALKCSPAAMDQTAANGYLEALKCIHDQHVDSCSHAAMDEAAQSGHLDVVKFLQEVRSEGCTTTGHQMQLFRRLAASFSVQFVRIKTGRLHSSQPSDMDSKVPSVCEKNLASDSWLSGSSCTPVLRDFRLGHRRASSSNSDPLFSSVPSSSVSTAAAIGDSRSIVSSSGNV